MAQQSAVKSHHDGQRSEQNIPTSLACKCNDDHKPSITSNQPQGAITSINFCINKTIFIRYVVTTKGIYIALTHQILLYGNSKMSMHGAPTSLVNVAYICEKNIAENSILLDSFLVLQAFWDHQDPSLALDPSPDVLKCTEEKAF